MVINEIQVPTLLLDKQKCIRNIDSMIEKARENNLVFRPHFKTHQSADVANWFRQRGVDKCTVSSVDMAMYFIRNHWKDITIAFPFNIREVARLNQVDENVNINILVTEKETAVELIKKLERQVGVFIKIDSGYHRAGVLPENHSKIKSLLTLFKESPFLTFKGFLTHSGHTYQAASFREIEVIHQKSIAQLTKLRESFNEMYPKMILSIGDTPSCTLMNDFSGIDEIRPGNFVFYDVMQYHIGSCNLDQIALAMACPIVEKHQDRNELVIYGGGIHFSKEHIEPDGYPVYGYVVKFENGNWHILDKANFLKSVSQEHGVVKVSESVYKSFAVGGVLGILPVHACMTVDLISRILTTKGENIFINR